MKRIPCIAVLLLVPFLFAAPADCAGRPAAAAKAKPRLKKARWTFPSTLKGGMASLDAPIADLQGRNTRLMTQILQTKTRIAQAAAELAAEGKPLAGPDNSRSPAAVQTPKLPAGETTAAPGSPVAPPEGQAAGGVPAAQTPPGDKAAAASGPQARGQGGQALTGMKKQLDDATASLPKLEAELQKSQSLLAQYQSAKQQLQDATQGKESNYQALLDGRVKDAGGFFAQRAELDSQTKTQVVAEGPCGDYPADWCKAPPDSVIYFGGSAHLNRECVAYAGWKRWTNGQKFANGDAGDWPGNSQSPTVGSVAIWNRGTVGRYGHVAYVTGVAADSITISEFNWRPWVHTNRVIPRGSGGWPSRFLN